jgi:putative peptide zinc metalloprotease protein
MSARRIGARWRSDLQVSHQHRDGVDRAVIKDPLTLRFFELEWIDYEFARRIEAGATAEEIVAHWQHSLPDLCAGREAAGLIRRAERLCAAMHRLGLADRGGLATRPATGTLTWNAWALRWLRRISAPMFVRCRLFDPDALLAALVHRVRPLFSAPVLLLAATFVAGSGLVALGQVGGMELHREWFASWQNLLALYLGILVLKVIHESGHALVCKALGGSVHEVGAQLLAFHPTFFVDVSDTWMWPDRRRRIAVAGAGFAAELVAAAALFWLWMLLAPGFTRDLCLNLMFIASVSAVLFNANPLMRYDGYHMLADFLREPQLRQKAFATISRTIRRWIFGAALVPPVAEKRRALFALYGILSTAYLVWIVFAVAGFLTRMLAPYGLEFAGRILVGAWLVSVALPLLRFGLTLVRDTATLAPSLRRRPLGLAAGLALAAAVVAFVPLPVRVERECVIEVSASGVVRASQPGWIVELLVREGDRVSRGQPLARLRNRNLVLARSRAEGEVEMARVELLNSVGDNRAARVQQSTRRFQEASATALQATRRNEELQLASPCDGVVVTHQLDRRLGRMLRPGDELLSIAGDGRRECLLPLTEKEARRVRDGASVTFHPRALPGVTFTGHISSAPLRLKGDDLPRALTALAGGDVTVDAAGKVSSTEVTHVARFTLETADARLRPGLTGRARLDCGSLPVGEWIFEKVLDAIHLDHRL